MSQYEKLRPEADHQFCECTSLDGLLLVYTLTFNPLHCRECKGMVDPERIALSDQLVESIYTWQRSFGSLYMLWLDSGEYEGWAKDRMLDPNGQVNLHGVALARELSYQLPTQYWWFHDEVDSIPTNCPSCQSPLTPSSRHGHVHCTECPVLI